LARSFFFCQYVLLQFEFGAADALVGSSFLLVNSDSTNPSAHNPPALFWLFPQFFSLSTRKYVTLCLSLYMRPFFFWFCPCAVLPKGPLCPSLPLPVDLHDQERLNFSVTEEALISFLKPSFPILKTASRVPVSSVSRSALLGFFRLSFGKWRSLSSSFPLLVPC